MWSQKSPAVVYILERFSRTSGTNTGTFFSGVVLPLVPEADCFFWMGPFLICAPQADVMCGGDAEGFMFHLISKFNSEDECS